MNWLLRQLKGLNLDNRYIRSNWPGSSAPTVHLASDLIEKPDLISEGKEHLAVSSFMVFGSYRLGGRFAQLTNFISDLEAKAPEFYARIGQNLFQWKKPAPKINDLADAADVSAIASDAEDYK